MKISARNQLKGKIIEVKKGAITAHVRLEIASLHDLARLRANSTARFTERVQIAAGRNALIAISSRGFRAGSLSRHIAN
jgi:molybdopterin-binding protein